jgi:CheY-like chemotaxis protein
LYIDEIMLVKGQHRILRQVVFVARVLMMAAKSAGNDAQRLRAEEIDRIRLNKYRILIVDDHSGFRKALKFALEGIFGACVTAVQSGNDVMNWLKRSQFDFIFTDLLMPEMDGIEVFNRLRAADPDQAIVIMSAHTDSPMWRLAQTLPDVALLDKTVEQEAALCRILGTGGSW